jgi:hypothetical protein
LRFLRFSRTAKKQTSVFICVHLWIQYPMCGVQAFACNAALMQACKKKGVNLPVGAASAANDANDTKRFDATKDQGT